MGDEETIVGIARGAQWCSGRAPGKVWSFRHKRIDDSTVPRDWCDVGHSFYTWESKIKVKERLKCIKTSHAVKGSVEVNKQEEKTCKFRLMIKTKYKHF